MARVRFLGLSWAVCGEVWALGLRFRGPSGALRVVVSYGLGLPGARCEEPFLLD